MAHVKYDDDVPFWDQSPADPEWDPKDLPDGVTIEGKDVKGDALHVCHYCNGDSRECGGFCILDELR